VPLGYTGILPSKLKSSVVESHHFHAAPAPGKNLDTAPGPAALAPTLLLIRCYFLKGIKVT
jgi:hypothetical protein